MFSLIIFQILNESIKNVLMMSGLHSTKAVKNMEYGISSDR